MIDYGKLMSPTVTDIPPSGIRKFFDLLESMDDVVALTVGQPDFITPWHIREAGIDSLIQGKTYYTSNSGTLELRKEISTYLTRRFGLEPYDPKSEIIVTVGGSEAIDIAMRTVLVPGDEVIIPNPAFVCYEPLAKMTGATPVILDTFVEDKFKITPERLKAAITPKTRRGCPPFPPCCTCAQPDNASANSATSRNRPAERRLVIAFMRAPGSPSPCGNRG
jgi:aminotransferase